MAFLHIGPYGRSGLGMWAYRQRRISCDPSRVAITLSLTLTHVDALGDAGSHKVRHPLQRGKTITQSQTLSELSERVCREGVRTDPDCHLASRL
jgi:hypothetical protein